jgi:hypothetical protein
VAFVSAGVAAVGIPAVAQAAPVAHSAALTNVARVAGASRDATAVAASQDQFTAAGSAKAVVLTRNDTYPDALAGGPFAAAKGGPLLLTGSTSLDTAVQAEIIRVLPKGGTVYILGGTSAISSSVEDAITELGFTVSRISGADRFATAVAIADAMGDPTTVFEATGLNYPDALAGGPAAIQAKGAILLTNGSTQSTATAQYLAAHTGGTHYALGGPAASADGSATALVGSDRFATAAKVADKFFPNATTVGVATGTNFPDALASGPDLAAKGAPLLLVAPTGAVPAAATAELLTLSGTVTNAVVFGGTASVSDAVASQVGALASVGPTAAAAQTSAAFTGRYGVAKESISGTSSGTIATVVDGNTGGVTTYSPSAAPTTSTGPTLVQLQAIPLAAATLVPAVNTLYKTFDTSSGLTATDANQLFVFNAEQVVDNPVTPPKVRLATYAALAALTGATVSSSSTGSDVTITASVNGGSAATTGTITFVFDSSTGLPVSVSKALGGTTATTTVTSLTTTNTLPTSPFTS